MATKTLPYPGSAGILPDLLRLILPLQPARRRRSQSSRFRRMADGNDDVAKAPGLILWFAVAAPAAFAPEPPWLGCNEFQCSSRRAYLPEFAGAFFVDNADRDLGACQRLLGQKARH